ncbi:MAG: hypothetical protein PHQ54_00380, partial [Candidatus Omnitrophica bacterium]|nr:hypothetical protein [Candidatus Omnitrophota bacterium]
MKKPLKKSAYVLGTAAAFILISAFINYAIQLKYSRHRLNSLERELLFKSEQLNQESGQKDQMAQEIIRLESQLLSYKEEAEFLSKNIQDMKIALREPDGFKSSIKALEDRIMSLDAERNGLEHKNQELQKQLATLSKSSDRVGRFKTENKELNLKLRQINSEYKKIDSENKILNKELKKLKDSQDRTDYLNSQNRVLTDELGQARSERDSLTREAA